MSWRPWTAAAKRVARMRGHKRKPVEPIKDWKIVRGDLVWQRVVEDSHTALLLACVCPGGGIVREGRGEARCGVCGSQEKELCPGPGNQHCKISIHVYMYNS